VPTAAILEAYARVEHELRRILGSAGERPSEVDDARGLAHLALERGLITPQTVNAVEGITIMRNLVAHGPGQEIAVKQAEDYVTLVEGVLYAIGQNARSTVVPHSSP
jgi:hypothetical protein